MGQTATPTSLTTTSWTGTAAGLADASDATYLESAATPVAAQTFLCNLSTLIDPGIDTGHQIRIRTIGSPTGSDPQDVVLALENTDDDSVIATRTMTVAPDAFADTILTLTAAEAATIHSYSGLRIRGYGRSGAGVAFTWGAVVGATSYILQIGTGSSRSDVFNCNVGNKLTFSVALNAGTYYVRVVPVGAGSTTGEQTVVVT